MPNRIIKESICKSDTIDQLSYFEEVAWYRLIVNCDDFGRFDGRARILRTSLFPLKDIRDSQIDDVMEKFASLELVNLYEVDGKPFVQITNWTKHQSIRATKSKYPAPGEGIQANENSCKQLKSNEIKSPRNPIQSNPIRSRSRNAEDNDSDNGFAPLEELRAIQAARDDLEFEANRVGLPTQEANIDFAMGLDAKYGRDWVVEAIKRLAQRGKSQQTWAYVEGTLKGFKEQGGPDKMPDSKAIGYERKVFTS